MESTRVIGNGGSGILAPGTLRRHASPATSAEQMDFNALLFPGRKMLYVSEVAGRLEVTEQHVIDLIEEGELWAINVGGGSRNFWRVPVTEFEKFLKMRASVRQG